MADDSSRISFDSTYSASKYRMFEVSGDIADRIEKGMPLYIKGEEAGSCVLTTSEEAFKLEKIETSNTVLLCVKEDSGRLVAKGVCGSYFELLNNPVDAKSLLPFIPDLSEMNGSNNPTVTVEELEKHCLFSAADIEKALTKCRYIIRDDSIVPNRFYRVSSCVFYSTLLEFIDHCILHHISLSSFSMEEVLQSDLQIPAIFARHLVRFLNDPSQPTADSNLSISRATLVYALARAAFLCQSQATEWLSEEDLQNAIALHLPSDYDFDISTDSAYLKGIAIHEAIGAQKGFHFIDTDKLRLDPKERFEELFSIESEWTQEELVPYIADLEEAGFGRPGDLLLKYCREVTVNEGDKTWKHYVLRH